MEVRDRIRAHIEQTDGLSLANVAKRAGLSNSALHKYVTGKTQSMTLENVEKIADAMDVPLRFLLFGETATNVTSIWDRIPDSRRSQALDVLETFAKGA